MRPAALTKTRIALSMVMATATLATSGVAASLALARNHAVERTAAADVTQVTDKGSVTVDAGRRKTTPSATFAPTAKARPSAAPSHTTTKGS